MSKLSKNIIIILVLCLVIKLLFTYRSNEKLDKKSYIQIMDEKLCTWMKNILKMNKRKIWEKNYN
jgi:hypothetical protein